MSMATGAESGESGTPSRRSTKMETALFGVFDFVAKTKWIQYALIAVAIVGSLGLYLVMRDNGVRQRERDRWLRKQAEEARKIEVKRREISEERTDAVTRAEQAARDHVVSSSPDELRARDPGLYAIVYGNAGSRSSETEGR